MSGYIGNIPVPAATQTRDTFTATAGQTSFATSGYTPNFLDVFLNGVHLVNGTDYTATNGSDVVLTSGAALDDNLEVVAYTTFQTGDFVPTSGGTFAGNVAVTGALTVSGQTNTAAVLPSADATSPIGGASNRYTNLFLSGGVYLGGTGSANLLDDYEEGTFSPTITGWNGTYSTQFGVYTKVGRLVYCFGRMRTNGGTGTFTNPFPGVASLPFGGEPLGSAAKGMWFVTDGTTGLSSSQTASGPLDGPANGSTSAFPNMIVTGGNVGNFSNTLLNASVAVEMRFFITYST
jgi:hypothetical protein